MIPSRRWWPALVALLCAIVAADAVALVVHNIDRQTSGRGVVALRLPSGPSAGTSVRLPAPRRIIRYGRTFTAATVRAEGARRDPRDPAKVLIRATNAFSQQSADCIRQTRPTAKVAVETHRYVVIATFAYVLPPTGDGTHACTFAIGWRQSDEVWIAVRLRRPLGSRTLWDASSRKAVAVFAPGDPPRPRYLPAGFHALRPPTGFRPNGGPVPTRAYVNGRHHLEIELSSASFWTQYPPPTGVVHLGARLGTLTVTDHSRCVAWVDPPARVYELCSDPSLPLGELIRTAHSVP